MSNGTVTTPAGTDIVEETDKDGNRVIKFDAVFPTLMGSVRVPEVDIGRMGKELQAMASNDGDNYEGGWTTYFNGKDLRQVTGIQELVGAIGGVAAAFARELKFDIDPQQAQIYLWASVIKPNGFHGIHSHPRSVFSGTFYVQCDNTSAPLIVMNPTRHFRHHELRPAKQEDFGPFTSEQMFIVPKPGELHMWPSWLEHHVPQHKGTENRIAVSFNVEYPLSQPKQ